MKLGKLLILTIALLTLLTTASFAADRYVRLRYVDGDVSIHPSDGQRSTEATINTPLTDGDEIETGDGRAELSFRNGITVRVGDYSALRLESTYSPMTIQLLQGTAFLDSHMIDRFRDELVLQAGDAEIFLLDEGNIRVDLGEEGAIRVTTIEGQAEVHANGRRVLLNSGERTYIDPGRSPEEPEVFRGDNDELDEWNESRMDFYAGGDFGGGYYDDYVDEDIYYDAYDLGGYGDWRNSGTYGYVWVPHVDYGWRPYYDGRWSYGNAGWFWISYEPWGWAPYHYGRWGWSFEFGWYWIPGNVFAPSWVSWYSYGDYIGWCPLNYYNNPIYYYDDFYYRGYRSIQKQKTLDASNSWTFVKKNDLGVTNVKKAVLDASNVRKIKFDKNQITKSPKKELVSYVVPKNSTVKGFVNDKRIIKEPKDRDIKSPLGIKHREEQFERGLKGKSTALENRGRGNEKSIEKSKQPSKIETTKPSSRIKENWNRSKSVDRDSQFKREESSKKHYTPYQNPYYKDRSRSDDRGRDSSPSKVSPWMRKPDTSQKSYERQKEWNPSYRDEAKKYFERFDHKNRNETYRSSPKSYEAPKNYNYNRPAPKSYEAPKNYNRPAPRSYEAPKREYRAPEVKRPDYSNRSHQSGGHKSSGHSNRNNHSNSNNNKKHKD